MTKRPRPPKSASRAERRTWRLTMRWARLKDRADRARDKASAAHEAWADEMRLRRPAEPADSETGEQR